MSGITLYIEPFSGASGDMLLSALCGLTDGFERILTLPERLGLSDGEIEVHSMNKNGIVCRHVRITDLNAHPSHESDHHHHSHHAHHRHHHIHRGLNDILSIIEAGKLTENTKKIAVDIFRLIGQAESAVHDISLDKIHFHEISGVDSILDIVGCAECLDLLKVGITYSDPICTGHGFVNTQHGVLPVPAPATSVILQGMPHYKGPEEGEKLTPTGAAIIKYLNPTFDVPVLSTERMAYGPGEKDFKQPNVIRLSIVKEIDADAVTQAKRPEENMKMIECQLDDASPEFLGSDFQSDLLAAGAIDFYFTPVQMKKGRPGILLSVVTEEASSSAVADFILEHTATIGLRFYTVSRRVLSRRTYTQNTSLGQVGVKEVTTPGGRKRSKIEYEALRRIQQETGRSIADIQHQLYREINDESE